MRLPLVILVFMFGASGVPAAAQDTSNPPDASPTLETIEVWVTDLGAERFTKRDAATKNLVEAGALVIEPLMASIAQHGLEVTTRGIYVLQQLAIAGDEATEASARAALDKIAAARVTAAARHARDALGQLDSLRQRRALDELQRLGAVVDRNHTEISSLMGALFTIEINSDWRGKVDDLRWLAFMYEAEQITFVGPKVEDDWLAHIAGMPNIRFVKIKRATITDAGLAPLKTLERLEFVRLMYMNITDDAVIHLAQCKRAMRIDLFGTKMTLDGQTELSKALAARVDRRRGAFLGIAPTRDDNVDWEIGSVTRGSAAENAGLRPGDVFVTYDKQKVGDFKSLTAMIAEHDPGRVVNITLLRDGKIIERSIRLGGWE